MSGPATAYTAEQDLIIAGLTIACEKLRANVERITFEITSTESRIATSIHDMGVSMSDAEALETMAQEAIGETAIEPMSQKHPTIASHLESRCRFLTIIGMKALTGRGMIDPSDPGPLALLYILYIKAVFSTLREPCTKTCKFDELRKFRETIGNEYYPSPLASWHMGLVNPEVADKHTRTILAPESRDAKSYVPDAHRLKLNNDELANGLEIVRAIFQLRPLNHFLPAGYIAEKCGMRYPSIAGMAERSEKLKVIADELCPGGLKIDVNALEEVAPLKFSERDGRTSHGWEAYLRTLAAQFPDMPIVIDDLLAWEAGRPWMARNHKGEMVVSESDGWRYIPLRGKESFNVCDETKAHGTQFNCLWSILAQGGLVGRYYSDVGIESYAVWTSDSPIESISYSSWMHIGSGIWVTVVVHVSDREVEDSGCEVVRKLGGSKLQNAHKTAFLPICGVSFRFADFDRIIDKHGGKLVNFAYLSKEVKPGVWTAAHSWHSLFEVSPLDFQSYAARAVVIPSSQLSLPLKVGVKKGRDDDMEDEEQTQEAEVRPLESAPPPESPAPLPKDVVWIPEYDLDQEQSKTAAAYAGFQEIGNECCFLMLRPTFDESPASMGESGSLNMPRASPMSSTSQNSEQNWVTWSAMMRAVLVRAIPGSITRYGSDPDGRQYTQEQVDAVRRQLNMKAWTVHEVLYLLEALSPMLAIRVASTLAYGAVPPSINMSATHEIYLIHDGILSGRSGAGKVDPEMVAPYVAQAARDMKLGVFDCRVIATEDDAQTMVGVSTIALKIHADADRRGTKRKTHLLLFWSFRECAVCDQGWNRIESVVSTEEIGGTIDEALRTLETLNDVGNVILIGPGNPVLLGYPANSPKYNELTTRFRVAWEVSVASGVLSYPLELILADCKMIKWGFLQKAKVTVGRVASRIAHLAAVSTLCGFGHCELKPSDAKEYISSRTPKAGVAVRKGVDVLAALAGTGSAGSMLPPPPPHAPPAAPAKPLVPQDEAGVMDDVEDKDDKSKAGEGTQQFEPSQDAEMEDANQGSAPAPAPAPAPTMKEPKDLSSRDITQMFNAYFSNVAGRPLSDIGYSTNVEEELETPMGRPQSASVLPSQTLHPQRIADRVHYGGLGQSDPRFAQYAQMPTAMAGRGTAHDDLTGVTYAEAREATAAEVRKLVKETTEQERLDALTNVAVGKPSIEPGAKPSTFYPDGDLAVDAATARLSERKKRADSNSQMMREMESTAYVATLFDRYSGNVISAMDARWVPEYGNRGELEAMIGAVISGLDGAMAQVAHMPVVHPHIPSTYGILRSMLNFYQSLQVTLRYRAVGAYPFNQLALTEDDLRMPEGRERTEYWPDAIAQTPLAVIQSLRTHLFANLSVGNLRPDQHLPPGFEYQPRVRTFRGVNDLPLLDGVTLSEEQVGQIYPAGVDIVGPSGSMSSRAGLMSLRREYRQPAENVLTESLPTFGADADVQDDDELMGKGPTAPSTGVVQTASASAADPSSLAKTGAPQAVKVEKGVVQKLGARKPKVVKFETKAEEIEPKVDPSGDTIMGGEASAAGEPVAAKEEVLENKPKPKARPIQRSKENPGVPEPPLPAGTSVQAMRSGPVLAQSSVAKAPDPIPRGMEPMLDPALYEETELPLMPEFPKHDMSLTAPQIRYTYETVPVSLPSFTVPGLPEHEDEDPILESYMQAPSMEQKKFSAKAYKLIANKQFKAITKLSFYERGATASSQAGKLYEASTVNLSENFRTATIGYTAEEAKTRMIGRDRMATVRLTNTIANRIPVDAHPDLSLVEFLEKEIIYAIGVMREFDREKFPRSFIPATAQKNATVLRTWERYGPSGILPLTDLLECLEHARYRHQKRDFVELPNQHASESYFIGDDYYNLAPDIAIALMFAFRRDKGNRFEVFVKHDYQQWTTKEEAYMMIAGVRLVFEYGSMPYGIFRKFVVADESPFAKFARGYGQITDYVDKNFPKWGWGVCSVNDWKRYSQTGIIDLESWQNHQVLFPFPPHDDRNTNFIATYMDKLRANIRVMSDVREELLPPGLPTERFVVYMVDLHAIADEVQPVYYHGAGFFAVKELISFPYIALAYFMDTASVVYNAGILFKGGPGSANGYRGDRTKFEEILKRSTISMCSYCAAPLVVGSHCCFDCSRPIYYPEGFFSHSKSPEHQTDPLTLTVPEFAKDGPPLNWELVDPVKFTPYRNFTASRSLAEEHRKITFFGVPATKSSDHLLTDEAKKKFRHNVRGALVGAVRFDLSIERLVAKLHGKESSVTVGEFFKSNGDFRRYYASLFLNCRDKPLSSYIFYSQHCRRAYIEALSLQEVSPAQMNPNQVRDSWTEFTKMQAGYVEMTMRFRKRFSLDSEAKALKVFREKMVAGPSEKIARVFKMNPEELSKWLRKTAFTFCYEVPESSEGLSVEIRDILMEFEDKTDDKWDDLDPVGTVSLKAGQRLGPSMGGEDITVPDPMPVEALESEKTRAERSLKLSSDTESARASELEKRKQAPKKPRFELPKVPAKKEVPSASVKKEAPVARAPGAAKQVVPPKDIEMTDAIEAPVPDDDDDMLTDTGTDDPEPSVISTAKSEEIIIGRSSERKNIGRKFFRPSITGSNVSSELDMQAEESLRQQEVGQNPLAAPSGLRRRDPDQGERAPLRRHPPLPPPPPPPSGTSRDRSRDPGYTASFTDDTGRSRLERREPSSGLLDLPAPPAVPPAPEPPEWHEWNEQMMRRGREKGRKGTGKGKDGGKGKKGKDGGGKGGDGRERTRTPPTR